MATDSKNSRALIAAATRGDIVEVERLIPISNCKFKGSLAVRLASKKQYYDIVKLLAPHSDTYRHDSLVFRNAARDGSVEMLQYLLPMSDPKANNSEALAFAIMGGHTDAFDFLLPLSDITQRPDDFISPAASHGRADLLEILLQQIKPQSSKMLMMPSLNGHTQCVELLLPHCDLSHDDYCSWRWAIHNWRTGVVRLMAQHLDVNMLNHLAMAGACGNHDQEMIEFLFAACDRDTVLDDLFHHEHIFLSHEQRAPVEALLAHEQNDRMNKEVSCLGSTARKKM